jgi:Fe-S cluster assembly scaffold protein SufB
MKTITIPDGQKQTLLHQFGDATYVVEKGAAVTVLVILEPGQQSLTLELVGEYSEASIIGVGKLSADTKATLHTLQHHKAHHTTSNLLVKAVLSDNSALIYDGAIRVEKEGQQTNAYQRNENLVLSNGVDVQSKPSLEILADDVRCTHGATVGTLDTEQLYFLQCRGIPRVKAEALIAEGFLYAALQQINDPDMIKKVEQSLWPTS